MKQFLTLLTTLTLASGAYADSGSADYTEDRELELAADGLTALHINAGAGSLTVSGADRASGIVVRATILVSGATGDNARAFIEKRMQLSLERSGQYGELLARFDGGLWSSASGAIQLDVRIPQGMALDIDDGSGSMRIEGTRGDVRIDDGSGSIVVQDAGAVSIEDGSGSIRVAGAAGDVDIDDGSGSIKLDGVTGSVLIDDGAGSISATDIAGGLTVVDDGAGSIRFSNVSGPVDVPED